jgi:3-oxoacyl-[acyl-carrier protein] reductase
LDFEHRVALVTGSSRGVGKEIALEFARQGADVAINYLTSSEQAGEVEKAIIELGRETVKIQADVSDITQVDQMVSQVLDKFGKVDFLINNAGTFNNSKLRNMDAKIWDEVISVNLNGTFNCTRAIIEHMIGQGYGKVINMTSIVGQVGGSGGSNYAAAKSGIIGFTKSIAQEVASKGITVNAISLGYIDTGMTKRLRVELQEDVLRRIPMKRFGETREVAGAILFLCSDDASYITGQVLNINGGLYM